MKKPKWLSLISLLFVIAFLPGCWAEEVNSSRVEVRGEWFYVDGEKFLIKGIGYSPYRPHELPWETDLPLDRLKKDFERIQAAGFNTLRTWIPLTSEQLQLAAKYNLMVIQGIWIDPKGDFSSEAFFEKSAAKVKKLISEFKSEPNVLMVLVLNEPSLESVSSCGVETTEKFLKELLDVAEAEAPHLIFSYANWPELSFFDSSSLDVVAYNAYHYRPVVVQGLSSFYPFVRWLKETHAQEKPLVITEFGLAVEPGGIGGLTKGGNSLEEQKVGLLRMWRDVLASGAAGGCVFEWNDEWWKNYDYAGDQHKHEEEMEEWFGILDVDKDPLGKPRPAYEALKKFNAAIVVSPHRREDISDEVIFEVNALENVDMIQVKLGEKGQWQDLKRDGKHWWKGKWKLKIKKSKRLDYSLQAFDGSGDLVASKQDFFFYQSAEESPLQLRLEVETDPEGPVVMIPSDGYLDVGFKLRLTDQEGNPVPNYKTYFSLDELLFEEGLKGARSTDENGEISFNYLVQQSGLLVVGAGTGSFCGERIDRQSVYKHLELRLEESEKGKVEKPDFELKDPGADFPVDYTQYGEFRNLGTADYGYRITDREGLAKAVGTGIYPNEVSVYYEPKYKEYNASGALEGNHWDFVAEEDTALSFFKWVGAPEDPFVTLFYGADALHRGRVWQHALKAFHAVLVHSPGGVGWTYFGTPWSLGKTAIDRIDWILRTHPELGIRLEGARLEIKNGFDNDPLNDQVICNPGRLVKCDPSEVVPPKREFEKAKVIKDLGGERTRLVQYATGDWQLLVDEKPFMVKGVTYGPIKIGQSHHEGTVEDWMNQDTDGNGKLDGPYDAWVDANHNNKQDEGEEPVGDFALLKEMGVNTVRLYHHASNKELLRDLYQNYGISVLMGDLLGMYNVGSGASWEEGTDYRNPEQRKNMLESVKKMVLEHKDEDYVLLWVLGNENNYAGVHGEVGGKGNAGMYPDVYYSFVNEAALLVKSLDPTRPVAICNGDLFLLDKCAENAPDVDIYGTNTYRGSYGFGRSLWEDVKTVYDRPVLVTEYGCPGFYPGKTVTEAEEAQANYNAWAWEDMIYNSAGSGSGNALGGILFQFMDEWWKAGQPPTFSPYVHETVGQFPGPFPAGWFYEEWFGVCSQGNGTHSPFMRQLRKTFYVYKDLWNKDLNLKE